MVLLQICGRTILILTFIKKGAMGMLGFDKGVELTCSGYAEAGFNSDGHSNTQK